MKTHPCSYSYLHEAGFGGCFKPKSWNSIFRILFQPSPAVNNYVNKCVFLFCFTWVSLWDDISVLQSSTHILQLLSVTCLSYFQGWRHQELEWWYIAVPTTDSELPKCTPVRCCRWVQSLGGPVSAEQDLGWFPSYRGWEWVGPLQSEATSSPKSLSFTVNLYTYQLWESQW